MGSSNYIVSYVLLFLNVFSFSAAVYIKNNGYNNIVISFSPSINSRDIDFSKLKEIFQNASELLFEATRRRSYFSNIVVTVPQYWDKTLCNDFGKASNFNPKSPTVFVQESSSPRVCHSGKCGERGQVIFVPSEWFAPTQQNVEGIAREFVKLWATYRYGVFEEEPMTEDSCFTSTGQSWSPTGCYNVRLNSTLNIDSMGLPRCDFNKDSSVISKATTSLMFSTEHLNIKHFCDNSADFRHSPIAQTRHNVLCNREPVWNIVKNNEDFKFGRNPTVKNNAFKPALSFQCYEEKRQSLIFIVQNASSASVSQTVKEIRHSLLRFLLFSVPSDIHVTVATFSDEIHTTTAIPVILDLTKPDETKVSLKWNIRTIDNVTDICISCGLKKATEIIKTGANSPASVVLLALASAAENMKPDAFLEAFKTLEKKLYFVVIEDKEGSAVPGSVISTIQSKGGFVFFLPSNLVMLNVKLSVIFSSLLRSPLQLTDGLIVVHEATFINETSSISDAFSVSDDIQGKLLYTFKCNNGDLLDFDNSGCGALIHVKDAGQECGVLTELKPTNETKRAWNFHYAFLGGPQQFLMCSSLATVLLLKEDAGLTVNGWLSHYEVTPGDEGLVIYAQVLNNFNPLATAYVEAVISRPRLNQDKSQDSVILEMRDNGNGDPDGKKGDGIFSRYFSSFTTKGVYTVAVRVQTTLQNTGYDGFHRMVTVGSFLVTQDPPAMDIYPPNRIADLSVIEVDHENSTVTLQWTAPGDDYDMGQVKGYEIKASKTWSSLTDEAFNYEVSNTALSQLDDATPSRSGDNEKHIFKLSSTEGNSLLFLACHAFDNEGEYSPVSNIVQVYLKTSNEETTVLPTTKTESTQPEPISTQTSSNVMNTTVTSNASTESDTTSVTTIDPVTVTVSNLTDECPDLKYIIILASSIGGGCLIFILVVNVLVCVCCIRQKKPRRLTKKQSMLPPHNTNIIYKPSIEKPLAASSSESVDVLPDENELARPNHQYVSLASYSAVSLNAHGRNQRENDNEYEDYRSALQLQTAVPVRVIADEADDDTQGGPLKHGDSEPIAERQNFLPHSQSVSENAILHDEEDNAQIYHLGTV